MTISSIIPSNTASAITPFNPLGKQVVGEEEKDSKNSSFKAVEETSQLSRNALNRNNDVNPKEGEGAVISSESEEETLVGEVETEKQQQKEEKKRNEIREQEEIRQLATRDREVRNHERAHAAIGGQYAGAPSYKFKRGPDGVNYAVSGEVPINASAVKNDPEATINKAQQIRRAALAPAEPSPQDRRVAARATQIELQAREDLNDMRREEAKKEKVESEQRAEEHREEAKTAEAKINVDSEQKNGPEINRQNQIDQKTNRRILELNRDYLNTDNRSARLGSIVSEAV